MQCSVAGQPGKEKSETGEEIKISSATVEKILQKVILFPEQILRAEECGYC